MFGKDAAKVLPQTLANAPHLDLTKTRADLQKMGKGEAAESRNHADFTDPNRPSLAQNGTIFIPKETVAGGNTNAIAGDYFHELANLLDFQINRYNGPVGPELNYGIPNDPKNTNHGDPDTGMHVEMEMFGAPQY